MKEKSNKTDGQNKIHLNDFCNKAEGTEFKATYQTQ